MPSHSDPHTPEPLVVLEFLADTLPFNQLDTETLKEIAKGCIIDFYPKGTLIFQQGVTEISHFYLIQKGGVKTYLKDEEGEVTLRDFRGEGGSFGALALIKGTKRANLNVETVEDTFCFLIRKEAFLHLVLSEPPVAQFFLKTFSEKLIDLAYSELREHRVTPRTESALYLFSARVGDIVKGELRTIDSSETVQEAARRMAELHIGSLLVQNGREHIGIVTDKDLRTKVVAAGLDYQTPVARIMSTPVRTISGRAVCFDALLTMMRHRIHHLAVELQGKISGVVTTHDIMLLQGTSPVYLFREILAQQRLEALYPLSRKVPLAVRNLIEEGAKAKHVTRMIAILNDQILERLLTLQVRELGQPPVRFCWLLMGSEGRREQTFRTDQDNALIYENPPTEEAGREAARYFKELGEKMIEHLVASGYPRCPGEIMASNPKWRQPAAGWRRIFDQWLLTPDPQEVLHATIFFDFRAGFGHTFLAEELREHLTDQARKKEIFLLHLAKDLLRSRPPLSFFRHFIVEKNGEHKNRLDLKTRGLAPFVDFARLLALKNGIAECNTSERLQALSDRGLLPRELYTEAIEAYEFLMQLRLVHQLHMLEADIQPDNYINPSDLSELEKQTLKEAFGVINRLQSHIKLEFRIDG